MKKKVITLFLTGVMVLSMTACGGSKDEGADSTDIKQEETAHGMIPIHSMRTVQDFLSVDRSIHLLMK